MTEWDYKATALAVRALNVSSILVAYQADVCEDMVTKPDPAVWEEITVVTDICLHMQQCPVAMTVLQERA